jgi:hypothetical protein
LSAAGEVERGTRLACLLVDNDARPDAAGVQRLAERGAFSISNAMSADAGWVELLSDGLTFDLAGLAPGPAIAAPVIANWYGVEPVPNGCAAITLAAGPHLAGAEHLLPVVRVAAALVASLSALPGVRSVSWLPADCATRPDWFATAVQAWLRGGPFPALALSALERGEPGTLSSRGLGFLIGHDFRLTGCGDLAPDDAARIAIRLTDWLVVHGAPATPREVELDGAGTVWIATERGGEPGGMIEARRR